MIENISDSEYSPSDDDDDSVYDYVDEDCFDYMRTYKKYIAIVIAILTSIAIPVFVRTCQCNDD